MRGIAIALVACSLVLGPNVPAAANCSTVYVQVVVDGAVVLQAQQVCTEDDQSVSPAPVDLPPTDSGLDPLCVQTAMTMGQDPFAFCAEPTDGVPTEITASMAAAALRVIPLPPSVLQVQPPNGRTLVNFDTNFFTQAGPFDRTVPMLGQNVDLHIVPSGFEWRFGDGASLATDLPGAPYPDLEVTHRYLDKGRVAPSVDTTYTATFRVDGGPWRDVPGSVTIPGAPVNLQVLTATPTLVGYDRG
jgi:hypothetical protein